MLSGLIKQFIHVNNLRHARLTNKKYFFYEELIEIILNLFLHFTYKNLLPIKFNSLS
jgi:hypothetical protein